MRISDWSSDVCSSDLIAVRELHQPVVTNQALANRFVQAREVALHAAPARDMDEDLLALVAELIGIRPLAISRTDRRISSLREAIDDDPAAPHGLAAMAALAGFSRFQTLRAFAELKIGRAHVRTPVINAHLEHRLSLDKT